MAIFRTQHTVAQCGVSTALNLIFKKIPGLNDAYQGVAHLALIGNRTMLCVKQMRQFKKSMGRVRPAFKIYRQSDLKVSPQRLKIWRFTLFFLLDRSTEMWLKYRFLQTAYTIQSLVHVFAWVCWDAFLLSEYLIDLSETCAINVQSPDYAKNRFLNHVGSLIEELAGNREKLILELTHHKTTINAFMQFSRLPFSAEQIIGGLNGAVGKVVTSWVWFNNLFRNIGLAVYEPFKTAKTAPTHPLSAAEKAFHLSILQEGKTPLNVKLITLQ
jgi:hypothetical protein